MPLWSRFNRTYREEVLDAYLFDSLEQVREITEMWIPEYNEERPHLRIGQRPASRVAELTPRQWKQRFAAAPLHSALHTLVA